VNSGAPENNDAPVPARKSGRRRLTVITLIISVLTGLASFALFMVVSYGALPGDPSVFRQRIGEGFAHKRLVENPYQEGSTTIGSHQWNDCLIIVMASDQRGDRDRLALAPLVMEFDQGLDMATNPCAVLSALNKGEKPNATLYYYDRYLHGAVVLLRYALPHAGIGQVRAMYRKAISACLLLSLALVVAGLWRGRNPRAFAVLGVSTLAFMRYFGLESFSQSLGHGPADAVIAVYLLTLCVMAFVPVGLTVALAAAAIFGALTIIFELFTGGVPIGLAMVIALTPLVIRPGVRPLHASAAASAAFLGAGAVLYLARMVAIALAGTTGVASDTVSEILRLTILSPEGPHLGVAARNLVQSIGVLTGGMGLLSAGTIAIALVAGALGFARLRARNQSEIVREEALMLAISAAITPLWCAGFTVLMVNHAWFTDRVLVWPIAAGFGLFFMALLEKGSQAQPA
jgi:hypothetical protein